MVSTEIRGLTPTAFCRDAGVRHNTFLMDAQQYSASMVSHPPRLASRRYTLLPIRVPGALHPKLIFLAGKHKGLVIVDSHSMTLAGFSPTGKSSFLVAFSVEQDTIMENSNPLSESEPNHRSTARDQPSGCRAPFFDSRRDAADYSCEMTSKPANHIVNSPTEFN